MGSSHPLLSHGAVVTQAQEFTCLWAGVRVRHVTIARTHCTGGAAGSLPHPPQHLRPWGDSDLLVVQSPPTALL